MSISNCHPWVILIVVERSPDERQITFDSKRDGNYEIYVVNPDGSGLSRLTNNSSLDEYPQWSSDGKRICFDSNRDGKYEIYMMNADGSQQLRVTNTKGDNWTSAWQVQTTGAIALPTAGPVVALPPTPAPPTVELATATTAPPTPAPATVTPSALPGVYVTDLQTDPPEIHQKQNVAFHVTFLNNVGAQANMKWYVKIFEPEKTQSFGETDKIDSQISVGTSVIASPSNWKPGGGVPCKPFIARVYWFQPNGITAYLKPDGNTFEYYFTVCP